MMKFVNASHTAVQLDDMPGVTIPVDPSNRHYREIVEIRVRQGEAILPYEPDPAAVAAARRAKQRELLLDALLDDASAGKTLDQIRAAVKADLATATVDSSGRTK